jgi:hypothetical protein
MIAGTRKAHEVLRNEGKGSVDREIGRSEGKKEEGKMVRWQGVMERKRKGRPRVKKE